MNVYFLVEGKTERKIYPQWINYLAPELQRVKTPSDVNKNNYFLISGNGYPSILDFLVDSVEDINNLACFDYLVLAIDTDDQSANEKVAEIELFIKENNIHLGQCQLKIIPQTVCMETWFLANRKIYTRVPPNAECAFYSQHYDVSKHDPELMKKPENRIETTANFHHNYLKMMLKIKNISYSKANPAEVGQLHYIDELKKRLKSDPESLRTMNHLFGFFEHVQQNI
ncbi:MAG: hypothetical protein GQ582_01575 [Methyloprofundus sp.]|nr:hypothetical protein [Methyloprofundus sp.]